MARGQAAQGESDEVGRLGRADLRPVVVEDARGLARDRVGLVAAGRQAVGATDRDDRQERQVAAPAPIQQRRQQPAEVARTSEAERVGEVGVGDGVAPPGPLGEEREGARRRGEAVLL